MVYVTEYMVLPFNGMETPEEKKLGVDIPESRDTEVMCVCVKFEMAIRYLSGNVRERGS